MKWWAIYTNLPVDAIVRLPHSRSRYSQGLETFLATSTDNQTRTYEKECSKDHLFLWTLRLKRLSRSKMKWWAIYTNLPVDVIFRLPHPRSRESQGLETFLAASTDKQTRTYDKECSKHHLFLSTLRLKRLSLSKMKWWTIYTNLPVYVIVRLPHPWTRYSQDRKTFLAPSVDK